MEKPIIIAHRGKLGMNHSIFPENCKSAIDLAAKRNEVDGVEIDVRTTLDEHIILSHDLSLRLTCGVPFKVDCLTLEEIKKYTYKGTVSEKIPTLEEVAQDFPSDKKFIVETKGQWTKEQLKKLKDMLQGMKNVSYQSFKFTQMNQLRELDEQLELGYLLLCPIPGVSSLINRNGINFINIEHHFLRLCPGFISQLQEHNSAMQLYTWTPNNPTAVKTISERYDNNMGIVTNEPIEVAKQFIKRV